jgi:FlaA1/EpsC-like NDP-sugar epimerase
LSTVSFTASQNPLVFEQGKKHSNSIESIFTAKMFEWLFGKSFNPETDIASLENRVVLVTGGNAGLGKETIIQLAKHNPKEIFLAARTPSKAEEAIKDIKKIVPNSNISFLQLDLSSFESVDTAAKEFKSRSDRLDILINNAGIMAVPYSKTTDGYE